VSGAAPVHEKSQAMNETCMLDKTQFKKSENRWFLHEDILGYEIIVSDDSGSPRAESIAVANLVINNFESLRSRCVNMLKELFKEPINYELAWIEILPEPDRHGSQTLFYFCDSDNFDNIYCLYEAGLNPKLDFVRHVLFTTW
jgi:hypothetical protein